MKGNFILIISVLTGGALGTFIRFTVGQFCQVYQFAPFWGTFIVNCLGCLLIGLFFSYFDHHQIVHPGLRVFLITGLCGGLTTFSTFIFDIKQLFVSTQFVMLFVYVVLTLFCGIFFYIVGEKVGNMITL